MYHVFELEAEQRYEEYSQSFYAKHTWESLLRVDRASEEAITGELERLKQGVRNGTIPEGSYDEARESLEEALRMTEYNLEIHTDCQQDNQNALTHAENAGRRHYEQHPDEYYELALRIGERLDIPLPVFEKV